MWLSIILVICRHFYRMHNVKKLPTGQHTLWRNRAEMGVRLFKKFLSALVDTASKNLFQTTLSQITPAQLMCTHTLCRTHILSSCTAHFRTVTCVRTRTGEKQTGNFEWQNANGITHGKKTKKSHGPSFHESRSTPNRTCSMRRLKSWP